jgi:septum formation protein
MAQRLAIAKARAVAHANPNAVVIGSDQVASIGSNVIGKPGHFDAAMRQLQDSSGRSVRFYTAVAVVCLRDAFEQFHVELFTVDFRTLTDAQITHYLQREQPYHCAGSFKAEGLGIVLFKRMSGGDPTSLEGLPLIALTQLLTAAGVDILAAS